LQENWRKAADSQMETVEEIWKEIRQVYNAQEVLRYTKRQKKTQWISQEVLNLSDQRKQLKAVKSLSEEIKTQYNKITREKVKECKEKWLEEKRIEAERSAGRQNSQKLFRTVNEICGTFTLKLPTVNDNTGKTLDNKMTNQSQMETTL